MPIAAELTRLLQEGFPDAEVRVRDLTGTGDHFEARVVSGAFAGKSMREQHQLVYRVLEPLVGRGALHGLGLVTGTPAPEVAVPDEATVWPGHDFGARPSSTIGLEKASNPFLQCRDVEAFGAMLRGAVHNGYVRS